MRLRKRAAGLILGAALLFLLGTNVQAGWLFVLAALLLGTAVAGTILPRRMVRGLAVERRAAEEVVQGDEVPVTLILTSRARGMRLGIVLDDPHIAPASIHVMKIGPGERLELVTARVAAKRGVHGPSEVELRSTAPFGIVERRRRLAVPGRTVVLPAVLPLGPLPFLGPASDAERPASSNDRRGAGPEYLGVREYRAGDSPRHVHWPSTARTGIVMVRELEEERSRRLVVVVDTLTDVGDAHTPLDACCTAAASIGAAAIAGGNAIGFVATGPRGEVEHADDLDLPTLRRALAAVATNGMALSWVLGACAGELAHVDGIVLVFPTWRSNADGSLAAAIERLAVGARVTAIPVEVGVEDARRVAALRPEEVDELVVTLAQAGAHVFPWRCGDELAPALAVSRTVVG